MLTFVVAHVMPDDPLRAAVADMLRIAVGCVWLLAGVQKLRSPGATQESVARLAGGPAVLQRAVARTLAPAEVALGLWLLTGWQVRAGGLLSAVAFVGFAVVVGRAAIRATVPEGGCGCFGARPPERTVDDAAPRAVARNLVFAILAVAATA